MVLILRNFEHNTGKGDIIILTSSGGKNFLGTCNVSLKINKDKIDSMKEVASWIPEEEILTQKAKSHWFKAGLSIVIFKKFDVDSRKMSDEQLKGIHILRNLCKSQSEPLVISPILYKNQKYLALKIDFIENKK